MKKNLLLPFLFVLVFSILQTHCGSKYSDAIKLNKEYADLMERYVAEIDKADDANKVATAMNRYADALEDLWPRMKQLSEKYPELKDIENQPEELKESQSRAEEMGKKIAGTFMKIMPYMEDPEVQKAQQRIFAVMGRE